jgi:hypothetical protein
VTGFDRKPHVAFPAYFFIRGLANRIARRFVHPPQRCTE